MRKVYLGLLAALITLSVGANTAFAAGCRSGCHFTDADGDGICDNAAVCVYSDADGDGICDICGINHGNCPEGRGTAFVDADGDGVCDNYVSGQGQGAGCGHGLRDGHGRGFRSGHCR